MKMKIENLKDLFVHTLKDIYFAERQIVKALPKIRRFCDRDAAPFIAAITGMSEVVILETR